MAQDRINCIIVEDNPVDSDYLRSFIGQYPILNLKAVFANVLEAAAWIRNDQPELVFMDIDMPVMNGMEFFKKMEPQPICIFVTAHSEYAWEGFEAQAFDFILKPVKADRFSASMERLTEYISLLKRADIFDSQIEEHTIVVKEGTTRHVINISDILYIEALKDYSKVVTLDKKLMTLSKLKHFIEKLPQSQFARIHRSYAVALNKVKKVESNDIFVNNTKLPIGKTFRNNIKLLL